MFSGAGMEDVDGTEWYFPQRLTDDTGAVDNGNANPAQSVLDVDATMGHHLPKGLLIYAFGARLGGAGVPDRGPDPGPAVGHPVRATSPWSTAQSTYAHNDPAGAYPHNVFFDHLVPFLQRVATHPS